MFIAVNSGNAKKPLATYLRTNKVPWPAIADTSREFEKACGLDPEISLDNIHQVKFLTSDGQLRFGNFTDLPGVVKQALENASWKIEPSEVPAPLKTAWRALEFGNYERAARDIMKGLKSSDADVQSVAKEFEALVLQEFKQQVNPAAALARQGKFWPAYKEISRINDQFAGFQLPDRFFVMKKTLEKKQQVADEVRAMNQLSKARELMASRVNSKSAIGRRRLKSIVEDFPDTEAAARARSIMGLPPQESFR